MDKSGVVVKSLDGAEDLTVFLSNGHSYGVTVSTDKAGDAQVWALALANLAEMIIRKEGLRAV